VNKDEQLISDLQTLTGFIVAFDPAGLRKWIHSLPLDRVRALHDKFGPDHKYFQIVEDRFRLLLSDPISQEGRNGGGKHWYQKPIGIVLLSVTGAVLGRVGYMALCHYFPNLFKQP
jgi:hypothetical protein